MNQQTRKTVFRAGQMDTPDDIKDRVEVMRKKAHLMEKSENKKEEKKNDSKPNNEKEANVVLADEECIEVTFYFQNMILVCQSIVGDALHMWQFEFFCEMPKKITENFRVLNSLEGSNLNFVQKS